IIIHSCLVSRLTSSLSLHNGYSGLSLLDALTTSQPRDLSPLGQLEGPFMNAPDRWGTIATPFATFAAWVDEAGRLTRFRLHADGDRKSTRLNSSHVKISYAVFCLKKHNGISRLSN